MKTIKYSLYFLSFALILTTFTGCTSDDNQEQDNQENDSNIIFAEDGVSRNLKLEGIYILAGSSSTAGDTYNSIRTDNPTNDGLPFSGKVFFSQLNIDTNTVPFITLAGQTINDNKDVFNPPTVTNFSYATLAIVRAQDAPDLTPNIKIERIEDVVLSNAENDDFHGQRIRTLMSGKFKITTLETGLLDYTSLGEPVNSITFTVDRDAFPRSADGMLAKRVPSSMTIDEDSIIHELFNNGIVEACLVETVDGNPNILTGDIDVRIVRHYGLSN